MRPTVEVVSHVLLLSTLQAYFPHSSGLSFTDNDWTRCMRVTGDRVLPPDNGWGDRVYTAIGNENSKPRSPQRPAPARSQFSHLCQSAYTSVQSTRLASAREEQSRLFRHSTSGSRRQFDASAPSSNRRKKRRRFRPWGHDFVCLASTSQTRWNRADHSILKAAGLGLRHVTFDDADDVTCTDLRDRLYEEFPKLAGQGYVLLRLRVNSTDLEEIAVPQGGFTPLYLSRHVQSAKVFIRPVLNNLSLSPVPEARMCRSMV